MQQQPQGLNEQVNSQNKSYPISKCAFSNQQVKKILSAFYYLGNVKNDSMIYFLLLSFFGAQPLSFTLENNFMVICSGYVLCFGDQ